jgi:hypothetical protein
MKLSEMFESPSSREVWSRLAQELGAQYWEQPANYNYEGGDGRTVLLTVQEWAVWLEALSRPGDIYGDSYSKYRGSESVRMRAPYENKDGFRFAISRKHFLTAVEKFFGMQDIEIGEPAFDEEFVIKGNDEAKVRALFANPRLRQLIQEQPYVSLQNRKSEILPGANSLAERTPRHELYFQVRGDQAKDIRQLKALFEICTEMLKQLRGIGSA